MNGSTADSALHIVSRRRFRDCFIRRTDFDSLCEIYPLSGIADFNVGRRRDAESRSWQTSA